MIKYRAENWSRSITPVDVERENEVSVWIKGNVSRKVTNDTLVADTWEEAHDFLMARATRELQSARAAYDRAKDKLGNIKGMKKPA